MVAMAGVLLALSQDSMDSVVAKTGGVIVLAAVAVAFALAPVSLTLQLIAMRYKWKEREAEHRRLRELAFHDDPRSELSRGDTSATDSAVSRSDRNS